MTRAAKAEAKAWQLNEQLVQAGERARLLEDQAATQAELIRAQADKQATMTANSVAEALIKRTEENFKSRELLSQQRLEAQLKPVAETPGQVRGSGSPPSRRRGRRRPAA